MKRIIGIILLVVAIGGIVFTFAFGIQEKASCSCEAGSKMGIGIITLITNSQSRVIGCAGQTSANCFPVYNIIPLDFIFISLIISAVGFYLFKKEDKE